MNDKNIVGLGLDDAEVAKRVAEGLTNKTIANKTKSIRQIIKDNCVTFFNILNLIFAVLIAFTGTLGDLSFMLVVICNLVIGLIQEISAKKTLDKLSIVVQAKTDVIRNGEISNISIEDVVKDDVVIICAGQQMCADGVLIGGSCEFNEALITGESDVVVKNEGDFVYSGSFVVSGKAYVRITKVGSESYANKLASEAKEIKLKNSQLMRSINAILKTISIVIIPFGLLIFLKQGLITQLPVPENVVATVTALIAMVPEGLVLLTSMALAMSIVFLALKKTLVQNLYSVESLARVDILCLDKTGTLTKGELAVEKFVSYDDKLKEKLGMLVAALPDNNATFKAVKEYIGDLNKRDALWTIPFSSDRKYSGACFDGVGCVFMGSYEFLFKGQDIPKELEAVKEKRLLAVAVSEKTPVEGCLPDDLLFAGYFVLADEIRDDASKTLEYFKAQDVNVKIISGDSVEAVKAVALQVGIEAKCVDMSKCQSEDEIREVLLNNNIFCRVLPEQKKIMVELMKQAGHSVAMIGDGVNDVLALKSSDCSIAMAQGSDAARNTSDIVLLNSDFATIPDVVNEGRRVINNIQRVATLFITKTIYSLLISLLTLFMPESIYPFDPFQLTVLSFITIGFPSFFISLEPDHSRVKGNFLSNVLKKSVPGALCVFAILLTINILSHEIDMAYSVVTTLAFILVNISGIFVIIKVSWPLTKNRLWILAACAGMLACCIFIPIAKEIFGFVDISMELWVLVLIISAIIPFALILLEKVCGKLISGLSKLRKKRKSKVFKHLDSELDK